MKQYHFKNAILLVLKRIHLPKMSAYINVRLNKKFKFGAAIFYKYMNILFDEKE